MSLIETRCFYKGSRKEDRKNLAHHCWNPSNFKNYSINQNVKMESIIKFYISAGTPFIYLSMGE